MTRRVLAKLAVSLLVAGVPATIVASPVGAHNSATVENGNGDCVEVGGDNSPPEGNAYGSEGHARGVHHASHSGNSAVEPGSCE